MDNLIINILKLTEHDMSFVPTWSIFAGLITYIYGYGYSYACTTQLYTDVLLSHLAKIKGIQRVTYLMSPWFEGNIFDVALTL